MDFDRGAELKREDGIQGPIGLGTGRARDGDVLEDVRREIADLSERLDALAARVDEAAPDRLVPGRRFRVDNPLGSSQSLRVLAMRMAVTGTSRRVAERRLRGAAPLEELKEILDEAYGDRATR